MKTKKGGTKKMTKKYRVLSDVEHVLLRPTMYVGETSPINIETFVYENEKLIQKKINLEIFIYKMFDEILTNSIDESKKNPKLNKIEITIDSPLIEIKDNGGIEVKKFIDNKYLPEVLFSYLRAGSNFDNQEQEVTGMYGVGASLVNIFSKYFKVETALNGKRFIGEWRNNSLEKDIKIDNCKENYTKVSFILDESKIPYEFNLDTKNFLIRRIIDFTYQANHIQFYLNGKALPKITSFEKYCKLYSTHIDKIYETKKLSFCLFDPSEIKIKESFVNGNLTLEHGYHVNFLLKELSSRVSEDLQNLLKNNLSFLLILNTKEPKYSSQDKYKFIGKDFSNLYINKAFIEESKTYQYLLDLRNVANKKEIEKEIRKIKRSSIPHYFEATSKKDKILFITEGESAALAGKSVRSSNMAFYSLRGKFINVTAPTNKLNKNEEFKNLSYILKNETFDKIVIMSDLDYDGNAIAALLINFFYSYFPEIIKEGKLYRFVSPLIKADNEFFASIKEFQASNKKYKEVKYCKGLGSFTMKDFKIFFSNLDNYLMVLEYTKDTPVWLERLFSKSHESIEWRKQWLQYK